MITRHAGTGPAASATPYAGSIAAIAATLYPGGRDPAAPPHRRMVRPRRAGRRVPAYLRGLLGLREAGSFLVEDAMLPGLQPVVGC
jgi:hypothetical protein